MTTAVHAIESSGLGRMMRESLWAYPIVETFHIIGLATIFGSVLVVDLRLLGLSRTVSVARLARHALPWTVGAFGLVLVTGLMMFTAHTADFLGNDVFMLKMGLILAAGINAAALHTGPLRAAGRVGCRRDATRARAARRGIVDPALDVRHRLWQVSRLHLTSQR